MFLLLLGIVGAWARTLPVTLAPEARLVGVWPQTVGIGHGDLLGDGVDELFVYADGGALPARLEVRDAATFTLLMTIDEGRPGSQFGAVARVGDINCDGTSDLVLSQIADWNLITSSVRLYFGPFPRMVEVDAPDAVLQAEVAAAHLIPRVVDDVTGDGCEDLLVEASTDALDPGLFGVVYVVPGALGVGAQPITTASLLRLQGSGFRSGIRARDTVRDLDGDGLPELVLAEPFMWQAASGSVWVVGSRALQAGSILPVATVGTGLTLLGGAGFGADVGTDVATGDLDGDGSDELVVGAPGFTLRQAAHGTVCVVSTSGLTLHAGSVLDLRTVGACSVPGRYQEQLGGQVALLPGYGLVVAEAHLSTFGSVHIWPLSQVPGPGSLWSPPGGITIQSVWQQAQVSPGFALPGDIDGDGGTDLLVEAVDPVTGDVWLTAW